MDLLTASEAQALTEPYHQKWADAHQRSWDRYQDRAMNDPEFIKPLKSTERAAIIHRHVCDEVSRIPGAVCTERVGFFAQVIEPRALVRFKLLDPSFKPKNYPTSQQQELDRQEFNDGIMQQLTLDGIEDAPTLLTCGYLLSITEDEISRILVVCHTPELEFYYDVFEGGEGMQVTRLTPDKPQGPRVTSKRKKSDPGTDPDKPAK